MTAGKGKVDVKSVRILLGGLLLLTACQTANPPSPQLAVEHPLPPRLEHRPIPASGTHVVGTGETLSEIAYVYRLNTLALARANDIADINAIDTGQVLKLRWERKANAAAPVRRDVQQEVVADRAPAPLRVVVAPEPGPIDVGASDVIEPAEDEPITPAL